MEADTKSTALAYLYTLEGVSSWVLHTATKNALKRKEEGLNPTFMPSTADFYRYCEKLESDIRFRADRLLKNLEKPERTEKAQEAPLTSVRLEKLQRGL
ncbi:hypothetical protein MEC_00556 [Bartonella alsatica IBS 382]|uniref:Uncharacterized protein n=1 Tax=Bartonella alsatica IBS 382 TaxID=1094551 RepID=J1IV74_9HYPH|nr:hypothetical protein MEC_00556 [Bartonella alsatica IBS 382]